MYLQLTIVVNAGLILSPLRALVSINAKSLFIAYSYPSLTETSRWSTKSHLLPTNNMTIPSAAVS